MQPQKISSRVLINVYCEIEWSENSCGDNMMIKKMKL
ncbi:hypothetical protein BDFB_013580 [Asbolus verrucosus]|uniref:Uncharacterized protein n=1 Tax=Asbolus verrucosus TaxID=1661398 RepID=A0A482VSZ3_ASBVE|nr:hypothetical protein BDFB_013580 [Asbolus verrucosus]